jgi:hypothetical protein
MTPESPSPDEIRAAREAAGLDQAQAAALIYHSARWWRMLETPKDSERWRPMDPALWEYWQLLVSDPRMQQAREARLALAKGRK